MKTALILTLAAAMSLFLVSCVEDKETARAIGLKQVSYQTATGEWVPRPELIWRQPGNVLGGVYPNNKVAWASTDPRDFNLVPDSSADGNRALKMPGKVFKKHQVAAAYQTGYTQTSGRAQMLGVKRAPPPPAAPWSGQSAAAARPRAAAPAAAAPPPPRPKTQPKIFGPLD